MPRPRNALLAHKNPQAVLRQHVAECDRCAVDERQLLTKACPHAKRLVERIRWRKLYAINSRKGGDTLPREFDRLGPTLGYRSSTLWLEESAKPGPVYRPLEK